MTQLRSQLVLRGQGHIKPGLRERCPQMTQQPSRRVRTLRNQKMLFKLVADLLGQLA